MTRFTPGYARTLLRRQLASLGRRVLRIAAAALLALLILGVGGTGLLLLAFNPNQYKAALVGAVQERYHRKLELNGRLELHLLPPFTLETGPMRMSEAGSGDIFAQARNMQLHLDALELLQRRIVVDRITLDAPNLVVRRDAQGRFNFDDLLPKPDASDAARGGTELLVRGLHVSNGDIALRDDRSGVTGHLAGLELDLAGLGRALYTPMSLSARAQFSTPRLDAALSLKGRLQAARQSPLRLQDFMLRLDGTAFDLHKLLGNASGSLSYQPAQGGRLQLQNLQLRAQGQDAHNAPLQVDLALPALDWSGTRAAMGGLQAHAMLGAAPATLRLSLAVPAASGPAQALAWPAATLDISRGDAGHGAALQARLAGPLQLNLPGFAASFPQTRLSGRWQPASPGAKALGFDLRGRFGYALPEARGSFALAGGVGDSHLELDGDSSHTAVTLGATLDRLDLDAQLAAQPAAPGVAAPKARPVLLDALAAFNLDAQLQIGDLLLGGQHWTALQARLLGDGRSLGLSSATMQGCGGSFSGDASFDLATQHLTLHQSAKGVQMQALLQALGAPALLRGRGDASLQLQTRTGADALRTLQGSASFIVHDGALRGVDLTGALPAGVQRPRQDRVEELNVARQTPFSALAANFRIADGVASSTALRMRAPTLLATGEARIDLAARTLDLLLRPLGGHAGAAPVHVTGSYARPHVTLLWSQTGTAATAAP